MRTLLKSLTVVIALLSLPSCTAYMYEGHTHHRRHGHECHEPESRFGVIGIAIARRGESGRGPLVVAHVLPGGPADQADVQPGDRIRAIDGESTRGMTIPEAARLIRGPVDAPVELRLESPRGARLVTLVRAPAHAMWPGHGCRQDDCRRAHECRHHDRPCDECRHCKHCREGGAPCESEPPHDGGAPCERGAPSADAPVMTLPPPAPAPDVDESLAPEVWPPTKPGHHAP